MLGAEHREHNGLPNRAEDAQQPTRQGERTRCGASPHLAMPNGSSRPLEPSQTIFGPKGIVSLRRASVLSCENDCRRGIGFPARRRRHHKPLLPVLTSYLSPESLLTRFFSNDILPRPSGLCSAASLGRVRATTMSAVLVVPRRICSVCYHDAGGEWHRA